MASKTVNSDSTEKVYRYTLCLRSGCSVAAMSAFTTPPDDAFAGRCLDNAKIPATTLRAD